VNNAKLVSSGITLITLFLPWYSVSFPFYGSISLNGFTQTWGVLLLLSLILAIVLDYIPSKKSYAKYVSLAPVLFSFIAMASTPGGDFFGISYGITWGIFLTLIASIVNAFVFFKRRENSSTDSI